MAGEKDKHAGGSAGGGFLSRWSQRKRGSAVEPEAEPEQTALAPSQDSEASPESAWDEEQVDTALKEIEVMKQGDDFKALLGTTVPAVVRKAALRKLWRSHPAIGFIDGLDDYNEDYTIKPGLVQQVRSAYQAGKGYVYDEEAEAERQSEIAARRDTDKQRDQERAAARAAPEDEGGTESQPADAGSEQEPAQDSASHGEIVEPADPESDSSGQSANKRPRSAAAARRWGGGSA